MADRVTVYSRAEQSVLDRLAEQRDEIKGLERLLAAAKRRRDVLLAKARRTGITCRALEPYAGIANTAVLTAAARGEADCAAIAGDPPPAAPTPTDPQPPLGVGEPAPTGPDLLALHHCISDECDACGVGLPWPPGVSPGREYENYRRENLRRHYAPGSGP